MDNISKLFDEKILRVLSIFYTQQQKLFHISELSKESSVPSPTLLRIVPLLIESGFVTKNVIGKIKIYQYNPTEKNNTLMKLIKNE